MTGYASAQISPGTAPAGPDGGRATTPLRVGLEIRSVNSRFLDLTFRLGEELRAHEPALRELIAGRIKRGKVEVRAGVEGTAGDAVREPLRQVEEYFQGTRQRFSLDLDLRGTEFEQDVWRKLLEIPFGETRSYGDIATALGNIKAVRAVGRANGRNTIAIVVPCHRVIGSDRSLTGYAGGLWRKQWLLNHEMRAAGILLPF